MRRINLSNGAKHLLLASLTLILMLLVNIVPGYAQGEGTDVAFNAAIAAPTHISPEPDSTSTAVTDPPVGMPALQWSAVPGATRYNIQVSTSAGFATTLLNQNTVATTFTFKEVLADGTYFWRVRAEVDKAWGNFSEPWFFHKQWSAGGAIKPVLVAPADDPNGQQVITTFSPEHFSWEPVPGAASYLLEISVSETFNDAKPYKVETLKTHHTPTTQFANNKYYWRVIPVDTRGHAGEPSETRSFTFGWNQVPTLLTPAHDTLERFIPRFTWMAVPGASTYVLEISTQENFGAPELVITTANTSYTPETSLANNTDYFWRVRAVSPQKVNGPPSETWKFRGNWVQPPTLLSPLQRNFSFIYPYFSWTPVAGAESYQLQVAESNSFAKPLVDKTIIGGTSYTQPQWSKLQYGAGLYWRVRARDARSHTTNWSDVQLFTFSQTAPPNLVYPMPYYEPDAAGMPIHVNRIIAHPLFVWDTTHEWGSENNEPVLYTPDYYVLEVAPDELFANVLFRVESAGQGAAPTDANPFTGITDGSLYYWRVTPMRGGNKMAEGTIWQTRIDRTVQQLPLASGNTPELVHPQQNFIAAGTAPVLGWLPVANTHHYEVQVSQDPTFSDIDPQNNSATSDFANAHFAYYVPWQGRRDSIPPGAYWWRVRAKDSGNGALGDWSESRRFIVMNALMTGNKIDYPVPQQSEGTLLTDTANYTPAYSRVATNTTPTGDAYSLGALHVVQDRSIKRDQESYNLNWVIAFEVANGFSDTVSYALYFDVNQQENVGATVDPRNNLITTDPFYRPEYVIYLDRLDGVFHDTAELFEWTGTSWRAGQSLEIRGGEINFDPATSSVQLIFPYTTIVLEDTNQFSGGIALTVYSMAGGQGATPMDSIPHQPSNVLTRAALFTDMPTPSYPFDTPMSNPTVFHVLPSLRWRMPYANSPDGYQIQLARHADFTQETIVETWESYESQKNLIYGPIPTAFHSSNAYNDEESYYWRVRYRHEEYNNNGNFDYGPWSQPMRFKLTSFQPGNPRLAPGNLATGEISYATPSFAWDRVEGAARYSIQIDNDFNMNSPLINKTIDGNSFTALDTLADGTYYWRVAMRRTNTVLGQWTSIISFTKSSLVPTLIGPANEVVINEQPTFLWQPTFVNSGELRIAAPRYRLQWDDNPQFNSPTTVETEATSYTPRLGQSLADGTWFWRVAIIDANGKRGPDSPAATFYKEYLRPETVSPVQGSSEGQTITFEWTPLAGAAYYRLSIDDNEAFDSPIQVTTDNPRYTHTSAFEPGNYYWRVQMVDQDNKPGPTISGRFAQGPVNPASSAVFIPFVLAP